jgi:GT2 family glycosyltransferase
MIDLSIIIVSFNTKKLTKACIESVVKNTKKIRYELIVVDNGSADDSVTVVKNSKFQIPNSKLVMIENKKNLGFGKANNQGMKIAKGKYILLLNSDTLVENNVLGGMVVWMNQNPKVGIASCDFPTLMRVFSWMVIQDIPLVDKLIKPFHPLHHRSFWKSAKFYEKKKELDWVTGAFLLLRRQVYEQVGFFDKDYFMYTEETDYCFRAKKKGWKVYYLPEWSIKHIGGASGKSWSHVISEYEGVKLFYKKHYPKWQYPLLRILLKIGSLGRIVVHGFLDGREAMKIYAKAFKMV